MRKYLFFVFVLMMTAVFCLQACSKKEEAPAPSPPPSAVEVPALLEGEQASSPDEQAPPKDGDEQAPPADVPAESVDNTVSDAPASADQAPATEPVAPN